MLLTGNLDSAMTTEILPQAYGAAYLHYILLISEAKWERLNELIKLVICREQRLARR